MKTGLRHHGLWISRLTRVGVDIRHDGVGSAGYSFPACMAMLEKLQVGAGMDGFYRLHVLGGRCFERASGGDGALQEALSPFGQFRIGLEHAVDQELLRVMLFLFWMKDDFHASIPAAASSLPRAARLSRSVSRISVTCSVVVIIGGQTMK